jgi:hypothetical protein
MGFYQLCRRPWDLSIHLPGILDFNIHPWEPEDLIVDNKYSMFRSHRCLRIQKGYFFPIKEVWHIHWNHLYVTRPPFCTFFECYSVNLFINLAGLIKQKTNQSAFAVVIARCSGIWPLLPFLKSAWRQLLSKRDGTPLIAPFDLSCFCRSLDCSGKWDDAELSSLIRWFGLKAPLEASTKW